MSEVIFGIHAVQALLERDPQRFQQVWILKGRDDRRLQPLIAALEAQGIVIQVATRQWLDSKVEGAVHQGIIAREAGPTLSGRRSARPAGLYRIAAAADS